MTDHRQSAIHENGWDFSTIPALSARAAEIYGEAVALEDGAVTMSFVALDAARRQAAKAMMACGVKKGDRVMIWAPNGWGEMVVVGATGCVGWAA